MYFQKAVKDDREGDEVKPGEYYLGDASAVRQTLDAFRFHG